MHENNNNYFEEGENSNKIKEINSLLRYKNEANCKIKINKYRISNYHILMPIYLYIILFLYFQSLLKEYKQENANFQSSIITIKIKQSGIQNIFYGGNECFRNSLFSPPDEVITNNVKQNSVTSQYDFTGTDNIIQLKWNNYLENWGCLFQNCINIDEIDFSQFDFSQKINGNSMFFGCKSITTLNLNDLVK